VTFKIWTIATFETLGIIFMRDSRNCYSAS